MNEDRVHQALDGDVDRASLTDVERAQLYALEATMADVSRRLRSVDAPDLTARVMSAIPAPLPTGSRVEASPPSGVWGWLWRPRTVTFRPAFAFGGLAMATLAGVLAVPQIDSGDPVATDEAAPSLYVQFRLEAPGASRVELAGSFTEWRPEHEMREVAPGVWSIMVPLDPGVHDYTFVIDGERMVVDPYAPEVEDSFGGSNSRLFLPTPGDRA